MRGMKLPIVAFTYHHQTYGEFHSYHWRSEHVYAPRPSGKGLHTAKVQSSEQEKIVPSVGSYATAFTTLSCATNDESSTSDIAN